MSDLLEAKVEKLADAQALLTRNVDRVTLMVEQGEKQRIEDKVVVKEIADLLKSMDKRMDGMDNLAPVIAQCKEEVRVLQHDWRDSNVKAVLPALDKRLAAAELLITNLETLKNKMEGGAFVISMGAKIFYAFLGVGGVSIVGVVLHFLFGVEVSIDNPEIE